MFFLIYTLLLLLGGIAMIAVGIAVKEQGKGSRILNVVIGLAFFGYGFYLLFLFDGDSYRIFFYVFVLPILLIVRAVKARKEAREQAGAQQFAGGRSRGWPADQGRPSSRRGSAAVPRARRSIPSAAQQQPGVPAGREHGQPGGQAAPRPAQRPACRRVSPHRTAPRRSTRAGGAAGHAPGGGARARPSQGSPTAADQPARPARTVRRRAEGHRHLPRRARTRTAEHRSDRYRSSVDPAHARNRRKRRPERGGRRVQPMAFHPAAGRRCAAGRVRRVGARGGRAAPPGRSPRAGPGRRARPRRRPRPRRRAAARPATGRPVPRVPRRPAGCRR